MDIAAVHRRAGSSPAHARRETEARMNPIMLKRIKFVSVPVRDQEAALAFWTQKVGLQVATDQPMGEGARWIELKLPGAQTGLVLFTPPGHEARIGQFSGFSFAVDNVKKAYAELKSRGVEFLQEPKEEQWGTSAVFKDVDGNSFVIGD
jgi:predicted enzyme related to lactoylglutathione lyase